MTTGSNDDERLLTAREAARYLGLAEGTVRNKVSAGDIPYVKVGTALRFRRSALDAWVEEHSPQPAASPDGEQPPEAA